jgi:hypothetical protein
LPCRAYTQSTGKAEEQHRTPPTKLSGQPP